MQRVRVSSQQSPVLKLGDSQMTSSPRFKLAAVHEPEPFPGDDPLIPGLPDDVALTCLLRLPVGSHSSGRAVCRRWHQLFHSKEQFFTRRKQMGLQDPWLYVFVCHKRTQKTRWLVLDLTHFSWHVIPEMPRVEKVCPHGLRSVALPSDGLLFVCGGAALTKFDVHKNRWTVMRKMTTLRSFFASGVINGKIYVAGGSSSELFELGSAEVMDPEKGVWRRVANMGADMAAYDSAVINGKFFVTEGWFWPFYVVPRGQVYDVQTDTWEIMSTGMREGWTGSSVVVFGRLFVVTEHERTKLKVYDTRDDSWATVDGPALPEEICKPFVVNCCSTRIYVVGRNLNVAVGCVSQVNGGARFLVRWEVVAAPEGFENLTPLSTQVLFA